MPWPVQMLEGQQPQLVFLRGCLCLFVSIGGGCPSIRANAAPPFGPPPSPERESDMPCSMAWLRMERYCSTTSLTKSSKESNSCFFWLTVANDRMIPVNEESSPATVGPRGSTVSALLISVAIDRSGSLPSSWSQMPSSALSSSLSSSGLGVLFASLNSRYLRPSSFCFSVPELSRASSTICHSAWPSSVGSIVRMILPASAGCLAKEMRGMTILYARWFASSMLGWSESATSLAFLRVSVGVRCITFSIVSGPFWIA